MIAHADLAAIRRLADLLDARFRIPGTNWRFGLDGLIGLAPGIGDAVTTLASLYIVAEAWRLGAGNRTLARMVANVAIDALLGAVPIAGDVFDFAWKANRRNIALLERDLHKARARFLSEPEA